MKRTSGSFSLVCILAILHGFFLFTSCIKQEEYPDIPQIEFREFLLVFDTGQYAVKGVLTFSFRDGNGDIGLNPKDTLPPYEHGGDYYYNLLIHYFEKQQGEWVEIDLDPPCHARIPVLTPDDPGKAIKGFISDTLALDPHPESDTIRLEVFIYDRALNKSNVITTPDIPLRRQ